MCTTSSNFINSDENVNHHNNFNIHTYNIYLTNTYIHHNEYNKFSKLSFCGLKTKDLIKPIVLHDISWSAGMIANLLFNTNNFYKKKNLTIRSSRRDWGLWKYILTIWFNSETPKYTFITLTPFSIRIRRALKNLSSNQTFLIITYIWESYSTPKRSIKRWLKKKYTTQSWR